MSRGHWQISASLIVVSFFLGSVVLFFIRPIERSFAGIFPLIVGSAAFFSLPSMPLLVWALRSLRNKSVPKVGVLRVLLVGLALPPAVFIVGFVSSSIVLFRGR